MTFDFCGVGITCQNYFKSKPTVNMNLVSYSQTWNFSLVSGINTLQLDEFIHFPQGSMILWRSNDGAQLGYELNPSTPDLLWRNSSVTNMIDENANNVRIYFSALGKFFSDGQWISFSESFPNAGIYPVSSTLFYANNYTQTCTVVVTDGRHFYLNY